MALDYKLRELKWSVEKKGEFFVGLMKELSKNMGNLLLLTDDKLDQ